MSMQIEDNGIYFNTKTRQFLAETWKFKPKLGKEHVKVSQATAERIARKQQNVALINAFLDSGKIELLETEEQYPRCAELFFGDTCECLKDGVWYGFYTENEMFVPMDIRCSNIYRGIMGSESIDITKQQFRALILYLIYERAMKIPLLDKPPEDYIEFHFHRDGFATDGTGVLYAGRTRMDDCVCSERWEDSKVHLVPVIPPKGDEFVDSYTDDQRVSVEEFSAICEKRSKDTYEKHKRINEALREATRHYYDDYDETRDQMERGLIDIYGEPGGWQFNNED